MASTIPTPPRLTLRHPSTVLCSSLPVSRHPTRRTNHLRSKRLLPTPPTPPPPHSAVVFQEDPEVFILQEEQLVATVVEAESTSVGDFRRVLLDLSWFVAVVFALQTVVAVVAFGWVGSEEKELVGVGRVGTEVDRGEDLEFEKRVEEIRAMASEARSSVANKEVDGGDGNDGIRRDVQGEVSRRVEWMRRSEVRTVAAGADSAAASGKVQDDGLNRNGEGKSGKPSIRRKHLRRKMRADIMNKERPKGFHGLKSNAKSTWDSGVDIWETYHKELKESPVMHNVPTEFNGGQRDKFSESVDLSAMPSKSILGNNHSGQGNIQRSGSEGASVSVTNDGTLSTEGHKNVPSSSEVDACKQAKAPQKSSTLDDKSEGMETSNSKDNKLDPFQVSAVATKVNSRPISSTGEVELKSVANKANSGRFDSNGKMWWSKLPYVLGVYLYRGSGDVIKGLYNLKIDPHSNGSSSSYTIFFQDRADATNLCYILETFFEDLDGFGADVVPLSINELHEAVRNKVLNVIVIRKRQLQLYAGQSLGDVEMAIRSIIEDLIRYKK